MCFSQKASFGAAAVLAGIGALALVRAKTPAQRTVALMPVIFAAQQCSEGVLWVAMLHPEYGYLKRVAMFAFLFFAEMVWPAYMPFIALQAEGSGVRQRRRILPFLAIGLTMVLLLIYGMIAYPTDVRLRDGHLLYDIQYPVANTWYYGLIYFMSTSGALLMSRHKLFRLLGILLLLSYGISRAFYNHYIISIWCYFAAVISVIALIIIQDMRANESRQVPVPA